ncbi:MAG: hypothetical protein IJP66_08555 [Kiritimatiellae bacterium]|nr:hypothetical protein [Kiritimatiellia bacterium]
MGEERAAVAGADAEALRARRRAMLRYILLGSLAAHVVALLVFGGIRLAAYLAREEVVFEAPPPSITYEPRKVELKVKVRKSQRSSSRPSVVPRMVSARPSNISMPEIKVDPKLVTTSFQPKFKAVGGKGLGAGLGAGYGSGGFGDGVSSINFFGLSARGERIAILVDVSVSMVEEERGGPEGFGRVRERLSQVVKSLRDGTLFTVVAFADACSTMSDKMVYASDATRAKARDFLNGFNTEGNYGLDAGNFAGGGAGLKAVGGTTRLDLAITAAMLQGADTIMIISDGLPEVEKGLDAAAIEAYNESVRRWHEAHRGEVEAYERAYASAPVRRVWVPPQPARPPSNPKVLKEGAKYDPGAPARDGYWREVRDVGSRPSPPPMPEAGRWTLADFVAHMNLIYEAEYRPKGLKMPQVHCIGYQIDKQGGAFLNDLARRFKGQYRLVRKLR